jgi:hypothetical protein
LWYHQHIIGHHAYINVAMKDPDIAPSSQIKREHQIVAWKKSKTGQCGSICSNMDYHQSLVKLDQ